MEITLTVFELVIFVITYLICSLNPAIIISRIMKGQDIRSMGSGNAGTTNAIRVLGKFWGCVVFLLDVAKVALSYFVIYLLCNWFKHDFNSLVYSRFLLGSVIGHCFPIYYGLKGGKGVVALLVAIFFVNKQIAVVCLFAGIILILATRIVSVGSIGGVVLLLIMTIVMIPEYIISVMIVSCIVLFKHRKNIERMIKKEENKLF